MATICDVKGCGKLGQRYVLGPAIPANFEFLSKPDLCREHHDMIEKAIFDILAGKPAEAPTTPGEEV